MPNLLVISVPGLNPPLVNNLEDCPCLTNMISTGVNAPVKPCFPAVTCAVQSSIVTGTVPSAHGVVANGWYQRDFGKISFWEQSANLAKGMKIWEKARMVKPMSKTAVLFWQNMMWADAEMYITPAPIHSGNETMMSCYSKPEGLSEYLVSELGQFDLKTYWGPMASIKSSEWITNATLLTINKYKPNLCLTYLPQLDYSMQKYGPNSREVMEDCKKLDVLIDKIKEEAELRDYAVVVISEYGMNTVDGAIPLNKILRENGFLRVRKVGDKEYFDPGASDAFAVVDHQIAHIYCKKKIARNVKEVLLQNNEIETVLDEDSKRGRHINHERSGDLIAIAHWDKWFSYEWWFDDAQAPDFAFSVDIHRKPGYDPLELFFDPETKKIARDHSLVKGSHGKLPTEINEFGVFITNWHGAMQQNQLTSAKLMQVLLGMYNK